MTLAKANFSVELYLVAKELGYKELRPSKS